MPYAIAAGLYVALVTTGLATAGAICWVHGWPARRVIAGGVARSLAGFAMGCGIAAGLALSMPPRSLAWEVVRVVGTSLPLAAVGMGAGIAVGFLPRRSDSKHG